MHARRLVALTAALISAAAIAEGNSSASHALVEVRLKRIDAVAVLPGADFRPYMKVILDPAYAAFREDVVREVEPTAKQGPSGRDTGNEVEEILGAVRSSFDRAFKDTYQKAGLEVVTSPGPDVLRLSTAVIDLYLAAPTSVIDGGRLSWTANRQGDIDPAGA